MRCCLPLSGDMMSYRCKGMRLNLLAGICLLGLISPPVIRAQEAPVRDGWRVGLTGAAVLNMHKGPLTTEDGIIECGTYADATDLGWAAGNMLWIPVSPSIAVSARLQYWKADGTFNAPNDVQPFVQMVDGSFLRMQTEYALQTNVDIITFDAIAQWYPFAAFYVGAGPQIGLITRASFEQRENILAPSGIEFRNGGTERSIFAGDFSANGRSSSIRIALKGVAGYDISLSKSFTLTPEVGYSFPFTSVLSGSDWKIQGLQMGLTIAYTFSTPEAVVIEKPAAPTAAPIAEAPSISIGVDMESVDAVGLRVPGGDVVLHEIRRRELAPLLPFVFFEKGSAEIPTRYARRVPGFSESDITSDNVMEVYHNLLNIVGDRMSKNPSATLTIKGHREPLDGETDPNLASQRAEAVKSYLQSAWGISPQRLNVASGELPAVLSNRTIDDGKAEHRRVEITSNDPAILTYVIPQRVVRSVSPSAVIFTTNVKNSSNTPNITVTDDQNATLASGTNAALSWSPDADRIANVLNGRSYTRGRVLAAVDGASDERAFTIKADVRSVKFNGDTIRDSIVERYRLMFFDFDTPEINDFNGDAVRLIQSQLRTTSHVRVVGYTDRIGAPAYNQDLSARRAQAVATAINKRIIPDVLESQGAGATPIVDNDLPEGRWYNRTVLIEVTTPLEDR